MTKFSASFLTALASVVLASSVLSQGVASDTRIHLRYATFDPSAAQPVIDDALRGGADTKLWIVQFRGLATETLRASVRGVGAEIHGYLPENAYVVRMTHAEKQQVTRLPGVRSVTYYHPAFRLEPALITAVQDPLTNVADYNVVVVDKRRDKPALAAQIVGLGGKIVDEQAGSLLVQARLSRAQLLAAARLDQVLWIDRKTATGIDMDNARIQGGADHIETKAKYTGTGVKGHVYEGLQATHTDFNTTPLNWQSGGEAASHGHCTAGIIFGNGKSNAKARGLAPDAQAFFTTHTTATNSRWSTIQSLIATHQVMFTTSSWGHALTTEYTAISADADDIIFDHDMPWTQTQSNTSSRLSRPEAWAKNIFSIGGVAHRDNATASDDSWRAGGGSIGPASDGRSKPDFVAYDDSIMCSDMLGSAGYNTKGDFFASFGGTSGATAICAGYNALAIQMFTDGLFGPKRKPNGTRWENRPHFTTLKALQIANASQYSFTKTSTDNRREHVGWGFPNLESMYENRALHYVVDETDVLRQADGMHYKIRIAQGQSEFKISLCHADPAANPSATRTRVNDISMRVTDPNGIDYWGNVGLQDGNYSVAGGSRDITDTVENVFIKNPIAGVWQIEVGAFLVVEDSHVETREVDADFGLVAVGGTFVSKNQTSVPVGAFLAFGGGCPSGPGCTPIFTRNWNQTSANITTTADSIAMMDWTSAVTTICSVDFYMGARAAPVDVNVSIYSMKSATGLPDKVLVSEKVRVSGLQTYAVKFQTPISMTQGQIFFVAIDNASQLILPVSTSGETRLHHEMRNNAWNRSPLFNTRWQYRVHGITGKPVPVFEASGSPYIGKTFNFELSNVAAGARGALLFGASDKQWGQVQLPFEYTFPCSLLVSGELALPFAATSAGTFVLPLPIPNDLALVGVVTFHQFLVVDALNPVGFIVSNAGRLKIGK